MEAFNRLVAINRLAVGVAVSVAVSATVLGSCANDTPRSGGDDVAGGIGLQLQIAPGVTINSVTWSISNAGSTVQTGSVNEQFSNTISFQVGKLAPGTGYSISLNATSVDGSFSCAGSAAFPITAGIKTPVAITLTCSAAAGNTGTVVITGSTQVCANIDSVSVAPLETSVNGPIALSATASAGTATPTFAWTATAGTFDNPTSATPIFTCPATPGAVTITVSTSPSGGACPTTTSQSVDVTCDALSPTFTNVYTTILGVRCTGCHRPGGGGVTVGMLDLSTQAVAYASLVGVNGAGTGAGTSGVTCASVAAPRVAAGGAVADSLLFNKVNSKLNGSLPICGSPMPLPAAGAPLTQAQVDLIQAWIEAGAPNN